MATVVDKGFQARLKRLQKRRHSPLSTGYLLSHNVDGMALARVRRREGGGAWRGMLFVLLMVVIVKTTWVAWLGDVAYGAQIARLAQGTSSERLAAMVLQADPLTSALAAKMAPYMH